MQASTSINPIGSMCLIDFGLPIGFKPKGESYYDFVILNSQTKCDSQEAEKKLEGMLTQHFRAT